MNGLDIIGAGPSVGIFDYGAIIDTAANLAQGGVKFAQQTQAESAANADADRKLAAAVSADAAATAAMARAAMSADLAKSDPKQADTATADKMAADAALAAQAKAGAAVPPARAAERIAAAQKSVDNAQAAYGNALRSGNAAVKQATQYTLAAAQQTLARAQGGGDEPTKAGKGDKANAGTPSSDGESFLSKKIVGPVKVWHAGAGGLALGVGYLLLRRKK
jgi:hypothetical protein